MSTSLSLSYVSESLTFSFEGLMTDRTAIIFLFIAGWRLERMKHCSGVFKKKKRFLFICIQKGPEMESRSFKVACSKTHRPSVRQWKMKNTCSDTNYWQKWVNQVTQQHWQQGIYIKSETLLWHLNTGLKCWINRKDLSDRVVNNKTYIIKKTERNK